MSGADTSHSDYVGGLFRSHYDWLCSRLHRHLDSRAHAEDIAADTFVQLLSSPSVLPILQPRALLTTIAQRLMYQLWRRRDLERAYLQVLAAQPEAVEPSLEERALTMESLMAVDALLDGLSPRARTAFLCSQLDGMKYADIAAMLGVSTIRVRQYVAKGLRLCCRELLEP